MSGVTEHPAAVSSPAAGARRLAAERCVAARDVADTNNSVESCGVVSRAKARAAGRCDARRCGEGGSGELDTRRYSARLNAQRAYRQRRVRLVSQPEFEPLAAV
ncbi:unnamed protein product [Euphydryas editha]|uniref:Uncharacterized protein n=1 Tax=Euphydryas editha TaxID=104508 RepID=A0AAU9TVC6_EUPED|nr:unnamed protein product [Euphydryas editha]